MRNRMILLGALLVSTGYAVERNVEAQGDVEKDFFVSIATQKRQIRKSYPMEEMPAPKLPATPVLNYDGSESFEAMDKLDSDAEMKAALAKLREQYKVFLQDMAPKMEEPRKRVNISNMQFRYESEADRKDFVHTLTGRGEWENITIPYYHGPQGPSTAWYRTEVELTDEMLSTDGLVLHFNGADYYCDAYVNGHHVGNHEGMLDQFEFDVKPYVRKGKNTVLVRLRNDYTMLGSEELVRRRWGSKLAGSNSPGWDDPMYGWNCCPAGYGLNQDLYFESRSFVSIADVFPRPMMKDQSVELWVEVDLPDGNKDSAFVLKTSLYGQNFEAEVVKDHSKEVSVVGGRCRYKMTFKIPEEQLRLWNTETPWLYQMQVKLYDKTGEKLLDSMQRQFGMRSFIISENSQPKGRMYLNGKEVRLRGANTMGYFQRDVMAHDWDQLIDDLLLNKLTNMNFIRTTQRSVQDEVYKYADRLGVMVQSDLPLFAYITTKQYHETLDQLGKMERLLRSHPSVILLTYLNESMAGKQPHAISRVEYENFFDAADLHVHQENPDRAIKYVDGDYQGPNKGLLDEHCYNIWYHGWGLPLPKLHQGGWLHNKVGWMHGCGEFGAEGLDSVDLMMRRYPDQWLPENRNVDGYWTPEKLKTGNRSGQSWDKHWIWFETQDNMADWVKVSREHQAWGVKMVTEAFRRMPRMNTFAIHLFIDAWPNGWVKAMVDCERKPKDSWFVYRDALTPLSVQLRTDRTAFFAGETHSFEAWICNDTHRSPDSELRYQIEKDGQVVQSGKVAANVPTVTDGSQFQGWLPVTAPATDKRTTFTVRMGLFDNKGKQLHEASHTLDLYPLPAKPTRRIYLIGAANGHSDSIVNSFDSSVVTSGAIHGGDAIVITEYKALDQRRAEIEAAVKAGANALLLPQLDEGGMKIADTEVVFTAEEKKTHWMLCRNQAHPWLAGTGRNDFKFWYSDTLNQAKDHRFRRFKADGFNAVLTARQEPVVAEKADGEGRWTLFQVDLAGKLCNPACKTLLEKILF